MSATFNIEEAKKSLKKAFNPCDYDSLKLGTILGVFCGDFVLIDKPNIYQPIDDRSWTFEQMTDETGEPFSCGPRISIIAE